MELEAGPQTAQCQCPSVIWSLNNPMSRTAQLWAAGLRRADQAAAGLAEPVQAQAFPSRQDQNGSLCKSVSRLVGDLFTQPLFTTNTR